MILPGFGETILEAAWQVDRRGAELREEKRLGGVDGTSAAWDGMVTAKKERGAEIPRGAVGSMGLLV